MSEASVTIADQELIVEYEFKITARGYPDTRPSLSDPGEPGAGAEFEITVLGARLRKLGGEVEIEMPQWLKDVLTTHLSERDDINDIVQEADSDPDYGRDPDYERDVQNENRDLFRDVEDDL